MDQIAFCQVLGVVLALAEIRRVVVRIKAVEKEDLMVVRQACAGSNRLCQDLGLHWRSPESGALWYKRR